MMKKREAFTLIELIISITIFVVFMGFVMAAYLTFHSSQQRVAATRGMLLESESIFNLLGDEMNDHKIHYEYYATESFLGEDISYTLEAQELVLISLDEEEFLRIYWEEDPEDEEKGHLFYEIDGEEPLQLNGIGTSVDFASFRIFPDSNPYDTENQSDPDFPHFQPHVQVKMTLSRGDEVSIDLQTTFTSRFYQ